MSSPKICITPECFETAYDSDYCDKCLAGIPPSDRGWVTNNELMRAKLIKDIDKNAHESILDRIMTNTDQLNSIAEDSYAYLYPEIPTPKKNQKKWEFPLKWKFPLTKKPATPKTKKPKKVFLSYAREDYSHAIKVYKKLKERGHEPWLDKAKLLPGQTWEFEIQKAMEKTDYIIIILSKKSVSKTGYNQREIYFALKLLTLRPIGKIFLIPVRVDNCDVPHKIKELQWIDRKVKGFYEKLFYAIEIKS